MSEKMKSAADVFRSAFNADMYFYLREENGAVQICFDFGQGEYSLEHLQPVLKALKARFGAPVDSSPEEPLIVYGGRNVAKIYTWLTGSFPQKETTSMEERVWLKEALDEVAAKYAFTDIIPSGKAAKPASQTPDEQTPDATTTIPAQPVESAKEKKKKPDYTERLMRRTMQDLKETPASTIKPKPHKQETALKPLLLALGASTPAPDTIQEMMLKLSQLQEQVMLLSPTETQVNTAVKPPPKKEKNEKKDPKQPGFRLAKRSTEREQYVPERGLGKSRQFLQDAETEITHAHPRKRARIYRQYVEQLLEPLTIENQIRIDEKPLNGKVDLELRQSGRTSQKEWSAQTARITEIIRLLLDAKQLRCLYGHIQLPALNEAQSSAVTKFQETHLAGAKRA